MTTRRRLLEAVALGGGAMLIAWLLDVTGVAFWLAIVGLSVIGFLASTVPWPLGRLIDAAGERLCGLAWSRERGRHHAFSGIALDIVDDGRQCWIRGNDLQRVLRTQDRDDVLAARHAGRWRRADDGGLMLRVDAVVAHLAVAPGRMDPHTQRLRRYLEREVLFPAAQRRERGRR